MSEVQPTQGRITFKEDGDANHYSMLTEDGRWWLAPWAIYMPNAEVSGLSTRPPGYRAGTELGDKT